MLRKMKDWLGLTAHNLFCILAGTAVMAFAIINIHGPSKITEGGVLGLTLFLNKVFGLNASIVSPILDIACFAFAFSLLGKSFLKFSMVSSLSYAGFLAIFDAIGPIVPSLYDKPWWASLIGGLLIGIGCSLVITQGGASGGDDALVLGIAVKTNIRISFIYLFCDFVVLALSLIYIPFNRIIWSFLTTVVSSFVVGQFESLCPHLDGDTQDSERPLSIPQKP